jgi:hypothetical protein
MSNPLEPLQALQAKVEARADTRVPSERWAAHEAVLDRLAANVRLAESRGWTSCAIERVDKAAHFNAWGLPPGDCERHRFQIGLRRAKATRSRTARRPRWQPPRSPNDAPREA